MLLTGLTVFFGVLLILAKLPRRMMLKALSRALLINLSVSVIVLLIHWGTFSGVMAASVAGLLTSLATSGARKQLELEGIVAKRADSPYRRGRSHDWVKIKTGAGRATDEERAKWNE